MSFELYNRLTTFLEVPNGIHNKFNSVSSPIYERKVKKQKSIYFESLLFAFLEQIYQTRDFTKYKKFTILFEWSLNNLKNSYFDDNNSKVSEISVIYENFEEMNESLIHFLRSYEVCFFEKKAMEFSIKNFLQTRNNSQNRLHLTLKLILISELKQYYQYEDSSERKKKLKKLIVDIESETYDETDNLLNIQIALIFNFNIKFYFQNPSKKPEFYKLFKENDDNINTLNIMKDKQGLYRILSSRTEECLKNEQNLIENYEEEKAELIGQIKSHQFHERQLEKEVRVLRKLYEHSKNMSEQIIDGCQDYLEILLKNKNLKETGSIKFSTRKKFKETYRKIRTYEKMMRNRNMPYINSDKKLDSIANKVTDVQSSIGQYLEKQTKISEEDKLSADELNEKELSIKFDKTPKKANKSEFQRFVFKNDKFDLDIAEIVPKKNTFITCVVCFTDHPINEIRTFDCDCKICLECLTGYLKALYDGGNYDLDIPCFNKINCKSTKPGCRPPVSIYLVKEALGEQALEKMETFLAYKFANKKCGNPQCDFRFELEEENKSDVFFCNKCKAETCTKCWKLRHPNKNCTSIDESLRIAYAGKMIRICPQCLTPATKDKMCDQVECMNCKMKFCFKCSAPLIPIKEHGNHYHRTDCKSYAKWIHDGIEIFDDKKQKNCHECDRLGKVCPRPNLTAKEFYKIRKIDQYIIDSLDVEGDDA